MAGRKKAQPKNTTKSGTRAKKSGTQARKKGSLAEKRPRPQAPPMNIDTAVDLELHPPPRKSGRKSTSQYATPPPSAPPPTDMMMDGSSDTESEDISVVPPTGSTVAPPAPAASAAASTTEEGTEEANGAGAEEEGNEAGARNIEENNGNAQAPTPPAVALVPATTPLSAATIASANKLKSILSQKTYTGPDGPGTSTPAQGGPPKPSLAQSPITEVKNLRGAGVIKGIIVSKQTRNRFTSKSGYNGFIFSAIIKDASGYLKLVFSDMAEQVWYPRIERGRQYYFEITSPQLLRPANTDFNKTGHTYELRCTADMPYLEFATPQYSLLGNSPNLRVILNLPGGEEQVTNIHLIVLRLEDTKTVIKKDQSSMVAAREMYCLDDSVEPHETNMIKMTLWGEHTSLPLAVGDVIGLTMANVLREKLSAAIKGLSSGQDATVTINQENLPRVTTLRQYASALGFASVPATPNTNFAPGFTP